MARGGADGGGDSNRFGASGSIGARAASAKERAAGAALASISEDASRVMQRRIWRDVALVFAGADVHVCLRVKENRRERTRKCAW